MSDTKQKPNYLLLILVAGAAYWFATSKTQVPPAPPTPSADIVQATESVLPTIKAEFRKIFEESATRVESVQIKSDAELFDYVFPATRSARESANKPFDTQLDLALPRNEDGTFTGKEKETAELLRRIAKSW